MSTVFVALFEHCAGHLYSAVVTQAGHVYTFGRERGSLVEGSVLGHGGWSGQPERVEGLAGGPPGPLDNGVSAQRVVEVACGHNHTTALSGTVRLRRGLALNAKPDA